MEHLVRMGLLFDFYGELLTSNRKGSSVCIICIIYLCGIAEEKARQTGTAMICCNTEKLLENWEEKLLLLNRFLQGQNLLQAVLNSFAKLAEAIPETAIYQTI